MQCRWGTVAPLAWSMVALSRVALGADGDLDPSFGEEGIVRLGFEQAAGGPNLVVQPDGKVIVCDAVKRLGTGYDIRIARILENGSADGTFGVGGVVTLTLTNDLVDDTCSGIAMANGGKIVLSATRSSDDTTNYNFTVVRLSPDGSLDPTFGAGSGFVNLAGWPGSGFSAAVIVDSEQRIVIAGSAHMNDMDFDFAVARLLPDGSSDTSFNGTGQLTIGFPGTFSFDYAENVAVDALGRIILAGTASDEDGALVRLLPDGSLDSTFGNGGMLTAHGLPIASGFHIDHAGRYVIAGRVTAPIDRNPDFGFARLLADGSMDASFGEGGVKRVPIDLIYPGYDVAYDMVEQADGKLVAVGMAETGEGQVHTTKAVAVRVDEGGQLDPTFGAGGCAIYAFGPSPDSQTLFAATVSSGHVIAVGSVTNSGDNTTIDDVVVRLQNDRIFAGGFD